MIRILKSIFSPLLPLGLKYQQTQHDYKRGHVKVVIANMYEHETVTNK
ncbi:MAG: hypothetical protein WC476_09290 [Phycisphaerae bacterium]